jgi:hypothetical protein
MLKAASAGRWGICSTGGPSSGLCGQTAACIGSTPVAGFTGLWTEKQRGCSVS